MSLQVAKLDCTRRKDNSDYRHKNRTIRFSRIFFPQSLTEFPSDSLGQDTSLVSGKKSRTSISSIETCRVRALISPRSVATLNRQASEVKLQSELDQSWRQRRGRKAKLCSPKLGREVLVRSGHIRERQIRMVPYIE